MSKNATVKKATTTLSKGMDKETTTFAEAMNIAPEPTVTAVPLSESKDLEPTATDAKDASGRFYRLELYRNGSYLGDLGKDGDGWAKIADRDPLTGVSFYETLEWYPHNGVNYYRIKGTEQYMSVSDNDYVGFYNWSGATGFTQVGSRLRSDYNNQEMSYADKENGYLTCWNPYDRLDVIFVRL